jgi:hypothetical protein
MPDKMRRDEMRSQREVEMNAYIVWRLSKHGREGKGKEEEGLLYWRRDCSAIPHDIVYDTGPKARTSTRTSVCFVDIDLSSM